MSSGGSGLYEEVSVSHGGEPANTMDSSHSLQQTATINLRLFQPTFGRLAKRCFAHYFLFDMLYPSYLFEMLLFLQQRRFCPKSGKVERHTESV